MHDKLFTVVATHLKAKYSEEDKAARLRQVNVLIEKYEKSEHPVIICGDFNDEPDSACVVRMKESFESCKELVDGKEFSFTTMKCRNDKMTKRTIDYVWLQKGSALKPCGWLAMPEEDKID